jgi:disulfide bond formation protein DsbB
VSLEVMRRFFALLALGANLAVIGARFSPALRRTRDDVVRSLAGRELLFGFVVALTATLGSLYLSEIAHLEPCQFCWYQRIAMYPIALILGIATWRKDHAVRLYVLALAGVGVGLSGYHYLIQNFPNLSGGTCSVGVPCTAAYFWEFGFISIPYMALSAFALIIVLMLVDRANRPAVDSDSPQLEVSR